MNNNIFIFIYTTALLLTSSLVVLAFFSNPISLLFIFTVFSGGMVGVLSTLLVSNWLKGE